MAEEFLYDFQLDAVNRMFSGCILNGGTGSGKSLTALFYYMREQGGWRDKDHYTIMQDPKDLYIITTAKKRDDKEWEKELSYILLSTSPKENLPYHNKVVVDSWQNIKKYVGVVNSFFIFDEDKVTGNGAWVKSFLRITAANAWIILSASPGDRWEDYEAVFIANGFFRNVTEMRREHYVYSRFTKYPKVERYINDRRLMRLRDKILVDMEFERHTMQHHQYVICSYNKKLYKDTIRYRWDYEKNEPIQQASGLCYALRRIVNSDESRVEALEGLLRQTPRAIIFYSFDYELEILRNMFYDDDGTRTNDLAGFQVAEYNGHRHEPIPESGKWVYLVNYLSGAEGFNCITCDTVIFYSQNYSYKTMMQAAGRIDRLTTPYTELYYYHLTSRSTIDCAITKALEQKKKFNEKGFANMSERSNTKMHFTPKDQVPMQDRIDWLQRYVIVHSYIYYELNANVVSDREYDAKARELTKLKKQYPDLWRKSEYYKQFGDDYNGATGFTLYHDLDDHQKTIIQSIVNGMRKAGAF